ncbi:MAG: iron complex outerrane recepter protein, partial [Bacteroidota bacterium]|nr:iron complex outerrane recepter protein [Bacteroidota bacterium]
MKTIYTHTIATLILVLFFSTAYSQNILEGIVKNDQNLPLKGANLVLKGTAQHTTTDAFGKFNLEAQKFPFSVLVQLKGYETKEVTIAELKTNTIEISLESESKNQLSEVVVSSRRRIERAQEVPIAVSVIGGKQAEQAGTFNVNLIKQLIPSVQLYSSNPRNTGINIRGLGSPFGLTNDGIDPGVGFYVDGVYFA